MNKPKIVDLHGHLGKWFNFSTPAHTTRDIVADMDRCGIDKMVVSHLSAITGETSYGNQRMLEEIASFPGRLYGYVGINPHYSEDMREQLAACWGKKGVVGLKLHPQNNSYSILASKCQPVFEFADKMGCPVLAHIWGGKEAMESRKIALRYPHMIFLMGHCGGPDAYREAVEAAKGVPNLMLDLTSSYMMEGMLEWMVDQVGAQQILFGSDIPFYDAKHAVGRIVYSRLADAQKEKILFLNALDILKQAGVKL
ncbi:amidohydrolase family protein [Youxingia wuxianensis]|uniref:Amidohydrolase family protein n=1 Tax=Youxingia wuxianensis TaxID=2763678 RepID=A0A926EPK2_9FIRM|nr:TatD family hydrolase [Youxingia wuxianensis]MBC8585411.1 amidohydrolase family protein [Youxingia wuxianensis]